MARFRKFFTIASTFYKVKLYLYLGALVFYMENEVSGSVIRHNTLEQCMEDKMDPIFRIFKMWNSGGDGESFGNKSFEDLFLEPHERQRRSSEGGNSVVLISPDTDTSSYFHTVPERPVSELLAMDASKKVQSGSVTPRGKRGTENSNSPDENANTEHSVDIKANAGEIGSDPEWNEEGGSLDTTMEDGSLPTDGDDDLPLEDEYGDSSPEDESDDRRPVIDIGNLPTITDDTDSNQQSISSWMDAIMGSVHQTIGGYVPTEDLAGENYETQDQDSENTEGNYADFSEDSQYPDCSEQVDCNQPNEYNQTPAPSQEEDASISVSPIDADSETEFFSTESGSIDLAIQGDNSQDSTNPEQLGSKPEISPEEGLAATQFPLEGGMSSENEQGQRISPPEDVGQIQNDKSFLPENVADQASISQQDNSQGANYPGANVNNPTFPIDGERQALISPEEIYTQPITLSEEEVSQPLIAMDKGNRPSVTPEIVEQLAMPNEANDGNASISPWKDEDQAIISPEKVQNQPTIEPIEDVNPVSGSQEGNDNTASLASEAVDEQASIPVEVGDNIGYVSPPAEEGEISNIPEEMDIQPTTLPGEESNIPSISTGSNNAPSLTSENVDDQLPVTREAYDINDADLLPQNEDQALPSQETDNQPEILPGEEINPTLIPAEVNENEASVNPENVNEQTSISPEPSGESASTVPPDGEGEGLHLPHDDGIETSTHKAEAGSGTSEIIPLLNNLWDESSGKEVQSDSGTNPVEPSQNENDQSPVNPVLNSNTEIEFPVSEDTSDEPNNEFPKVTHPSMPTESSIPDDQITSEAPNAILNAIQINEARPTSGDQDLTSTTQHILTNIPTNSLRQPPSENQYNTPVIPTAHQLDSANEGERPFDVYYHEVNPFIRKPFQHISRPFFKLDKFMSSLLTGFRQTESISEPSNLLQRQQRSSDLSQIFLLHM